MSNDANIKDHVLAVIVADTLEDQEAGTGAVFPGGEINTASNLDTPGLYKQKVASDLQFRGISTDTPSDIEIKLSSDDLALEVNYIGLAGQVTGLQDSYENVNSISTLIASGPLSLTADEADVVLTALNKDVVIAGGPGGGVFLSGGSVGLSMRGDAGGISILGDDEPIEMSALNGINISTDTNLNISNTDPLADGTIYIESGKGALTNGGSLELNAGGADWKAGITGGNPIGSVLRLGQENGGKFQADNSLVSLVDDNPGYSAAASNSIVAENREIGGANTSILSNQLATSGPTSTGTTAITIQSDNQGAIANTSDVTIAATNTSGGVGDLISADTVISVESAGDINITAGEFADSEISIESPLVSFNAGSFTLPIGITDGTATELDTTAKTFAEAINELAASATVTDLQTAYDGGGSIITSLEDFSVTGTQDVVLHGTTISSADDITGINSTVYDTTTPPSHNNKTIFWDDAKNCPAYYNDRTSVTNQLGREIWRRVQNNTGGNLENGKVVKVTGWGSPNPTVEYASNELIADAEAVIAVLTETILNGESGEATIIGEVNNLDTSGETSGTTVYMGGTPGEWTTTRPMPPCYEVRLGTIGIVNATAGSMLVNLVGFNSTDTGINSEGMLNGIAPQRQGVSFAVDTGVIYAYVVNEQNPTTPLPVVIGGKRYSLDTITGAGPGGAARVALIPGTVMLPVKNWIYAKLVGSEVTLVASATKPTPPTETEFAILGYAAVKDVASTSTYGIRSFQRYNNSIDNGDSDGILEVIASHNRHRGVQYEDGVSPTVSLVGTSPTSVNVTLTEGQVRQLRVQTYDAIDGTEYYILNHPTGGDKVITDLNEIDVTSVGVSFSNKDVVLLEILGGQMSSGGIDRIYVSLPRGVYTAADGAAAAIQDLKGYANSTVPLGTGLEKTAFRICTLVLRYKTGNTWENVVDQEESADFIDRRGAVLGATGGGGGGASQLNDLDDVIISTPVANEILAYSGEGAWTNATDYAIHTNRGAEISGITEKVTPADADLLVIEDSAVAYGKKKLQVSSLPFGEVNTSSNLGTGYWLAKSKVGVDFPFRSVAAGKNIIIDSNSNDITINALPGVEYMAVPWRGEMMAEVDGSVDNIGVFCKVAVNQSNPSGGLPLTSLTKTYLAGEIAPYTTWTDTNIVRIHVLVARCATGVATVGTTPTFRLDVYTHTNTSRSLARTIRVPKVSGSIGVNNNLGGTGIYSIFAVNLATPLGISANSLVGFEFVGEDTSEDTINSIARCTVLLNAQSGTFA